MAILSVLSVEPGVARTHHPGRAVRAGMVRVWRAIGLRFGGYCIILAPCASVCIQGVSVGTSSTSCAIVTRGKVPHVATTVCQSPRDCWALRVRETAQARGVVHQLGLVRIGGAQQTIAVRARAPLPTLETPCTDSVCVVHSTLEVGVVCRVSGTLQTRCDSTLVNLPEAHTWHMPSFS